MKRSDFIKLAGVVLGAAVAPRVLAAESESDLRRIAVDYYKVYYRDLNKKLYRSMLTDDYVLLENGEIISLEQDVALMPSLEDNYVRDDSFDFRSITIHRDIGYLVYFLKSDISDKKGGARHREFLETLIVRRDEAGSWRIALLHSTRIASA